MAWIASREWTIYATDKKSKTDYVSTISIRTQVEINDILDSLLMLKTSLTNAEVS